MTNKYPNETEMSHQKKIGNYHFFQNKLFDDPLTIISTSIVSLSYRARSEKWNWNG